MSTDIVFQGKLKDFNNEKRREVTFELTRIRIIKIRRHDHVILA